jgi:hypothetical protein
MSLLATGCATEQIDVENSSPTLKGGSAKVIYQCLSREMSKVFSKVLWTKAC